MAKKDTVTLKVKAKNLMARGLKRAGRALRSFAGGVRKLAKGVAVSFAAASAAVVAFSVKAIQAYSEQERAERKLIAAMNAHGEAGEALIPKYKRIASEIQDATGAADEMTLALMANLKQLGVQSTELERATKLVIALKNVDVARKTAVRMVARAMQGDIDALKTYIPAVRNATSEAEKHAELQKFLTQNYQEQADLIETTVSGAWKNFTGRVGDAMEEVGEMIVKAFNVRRAINKAAEAVKGWGRAVAEWVQSKQFERVQSAVANIAATMAKGSGDQRVELLKRIGAVMKDSFVVAGKAAVDVMMDAAPMIGELIGTAVKGMVRDLLPTIAQGGEEYKKAAKQIGREEYEGDKFGIKYYTDEQDKAIKQQVRRNRMEERIEAVRERQAKQTGKDAGALDNLKQSYGELLRYAEAVNKERSESLAGDDTSEKDRGKELEHNFDLTDEFIKQQKSLRKETAKEAGTLDKFDKAINEKLKTRRRVLSKIWKLEKTGSGTVEKARKLQNKIQKITEDINKLDKDRGEKLDEINRLMRKGEQIQRDRKEQSKLEADAAELAAEAEERRQKARKAMFRDIEDPMQERVNRFVERRKEAQNARRMDRETRQKWEDLEKKAQDPFQRLSGEEREWIQNIQQFQKAQQKARQERQKARELEQRREDLLDQQLTKLKSIDEKLIKTLQAAPGGD